MEFIVYSEGYVPEQQFGDMIVSVLYLRSREGKFSGLLLGSC